MLRERIFSIEPAALLIVPPLVVAFTVTQATVARALGVGIIHVALGVGPTLYQRGRLRLNALPIGAHVQFAMEDGETDGLRYDTLPAPQKLALLLSGPAVLAALSLPLGALHPDLGWLCSALAVLNLLPLPGLSGGQSLITLAEAARGKPLPGGLLVAWSLSGALGLLAGLVWLFLV